MYVTTVNSSGVRSMRKIAWAAQPVTATQPAIPGVADPAQQQLLERVVAFGRVAGPAAVAAVAGALMYVLATAGIAKLDDPPRAVSTPEIPVTVSEYAAP
jgi:hypothetical protein